MLGKACLVLIVAASGCGAARLIQRTPQGGVIELQGDKVKAMEDANQQMAAHCGAGNFSIMREGEEPVGTDTIQQQQTQDTTKTSRDGQRTTETETTTNVTSKRTATVWRVHYACGAPAQPIAAPQPDDPDQPVAAPDQPAAADPNLPPAPGN